MWPLRGGNQRGNQFLGNDEMAVYNELTSRCQKIKIDYQTKKLLKMS